MEHELKIHPRYLDDVISGRKTFEIRRDDRGYQIGDTLVLKGWDGISYSGKAVRAQVTYMIDDRFTGLMPGYAVMGIALEKLDISGDNRMKGARWKD